MPSVNLGVRYALPPCACAPIDSMPALKALVLDRDGTLEVFEVGPVTRRRLVRLLPSVFKGGHVNEPEVRITGVVKARLDSPGVVAYADGERIGPLPIEVVVRRGVLRLHTLD